MNYLRAGEREKELQGEGERVRVTTAKAHRQGATRKENPMKHDTIEILGCLTFGALLCALVILMLAC